jgi:hypothetical protein
MKHVIKIMILKIKANFEKNIWNSLTFKITFRDHIVVRERRFRALVLQNHPKSISLFDILKII